MGHERIGTLPRTKRWRDLVADIGSADTGTAVGQLAVRTLEIVRKRFAKLPDDGGVQAAFGFMVSLATAHLPPRTGLAGATPDLSGSPSPVRLAVELDAWIRTHTDSQEYAALAGRACADAIARWTQSHSRQQPLFSSVTSADIWRQAARGDGFSEVARLFFARLTHRYIRYFIEREASAEHLNVGSREAFSERLERIIEGASLHAFESAKVAQSFAAGWFNKNARDARPSDKQIRGFLRHALGKIEEELRREVRDASD